MALAAKLREAIDQGKPITSADLLRAANEAYGGTIGAGKYTPKDAYDALELAVNQHIAAHPQLYDPNAPLEYARDAVRRLTALVDALPTHTRRTGEQQSFQQFSTPPAYAYAVNWIANIGPQDHVLEPSAGIGGLLVHAMNAGAAQTIGNELSQRRAELLRALGPSRVYTENAEHLNAILPADVKPTVVVMNPPFSQTAGRMGDKKVLMTGANHIQEALKRLAPGGRLVAIVGGGMAPDSPTFRQWFRQIAAQHRILANVLVGRDVYKKYGTSFPTRVLVIDKLPPTDQKPLATGVQGVVNLLDALQEVRDARQQQPATQQPAQPAKAEQPPAKPGGVLPAQESGGGRPAAVEPVPAPVSGVGAAQQRPVNRPPEPPVQAGATGGGPPASPARPPVAGVLQRPAEPGGTTGGRQQAEGAEPGGRGGEAPPATHAGEQSGELTVSSNTDPEVHGGEISEAVYDEYAPQKLRMQGPRPHGTPLVQSAAMASVSPPEPTYRPKIDPSVFKEDVLSLPQMEAVVYAGQAHEQILPDGSRRGFFIGDGTGVGKGQQIAGIFLDNFNRGRKRGVWVSENFKLHKDAQRDWQAVGRNPAEIVRHNKFKPNEPIALPEGILFTGYKTLSKEPSHTAAGTAGPKPPKGMEDVAARVRQIAEWLGPDFDGVIAFDEAHNMKNALAMKGKRGMTKPSDVAAAGIALQKALPNARIVYVSATGATDVGNLAYADRLGLWGEGTAFPNKLEFVSQIEGSGLAAMELVARDMKAMGSYLARSLSFKGVRQERLVHELTPEQVEIYDKLAEGWQVVLRNMEEALKITAGDHSGKIDPKAAMRAKAVFWSTNQRFFNQVTTAMQMPSMLADIEQQLKAGKSAIVQFVNTNEAAMSRELAKLGDQEEGDDSALENLDLTPRQQLMEMIKKSFPTQQYEEAIDENGKPYMRPVRDSKGDPVHNPQAIAMRDKLLDELASIRVPDGPLDMLINHFGHDKVAENTGRSQRVVRTAKGMELQKWSPAKSLNDVQAFLNDKKQILAFSQAGGTGASYHADARFKNQRDRVHYLAQAGWIADKAVQGLGRSHRSNEVSQPLYRLVTTNLKGQKRFISTIARRLDQLGALSTGDRRGGGKGIFKPEDNLESREAHDAMRLFFYDLHRGVVPDMSLSDFERQSGLRLRNEQTGELRKDLPPVPQFLNRLLAFNTGDQDKVFDAYAERLDAVIQAAIANGTLDTGVETVRADSITKQHEQTVYTDPRTKAETKYVQLLLRKMNHPASFEQAARIRGFIGYAENTKSGAVVAYGNGPTRTEKSGSVVSQYRLQGPLKNRMLPLHEFNNPNGGWRTIDDKQIAREKWEKHVGELPTHTEQDMHMISGAVLPIWDRLGDSHPRVFRVQTDEGQRILGREIPEDELADTLVRLGVGSQAGNAQMTPEQALEAVTTDGDTLHLANGWRIKPSRVGGELRPEIIGPNLPDVPILKDQGVQIERIQFQNRFFVPTGEAGEPVIKKVLANRPIVRRQRRQGFVDFITPLEGLAKVMRYVDRSARRLGGQLFPAITDEYRPAGEAGAHYIASGVYAAEAPPVLAREIFGDDPEIATIAAAALVQDDLDGIRQQFIDQGNGAAAAKVTSMIGAEGSPFENREDYAAWGDDQRVQDIIGRWKDWWQREPEQNYRVSQEISPDEELPARGPRFGARTNLKAVFEDEARPPAEALRDISSPRGNLSNPLKKASPHARKAKGTGASYEIDPTKLIANALRGTEIANQRRFYTALINGGLAKYGPPGQTVKLGDKPTVGIDVRRRVVVVPGRPPIPQNQKLYVRADLYKEVRQALNVDSPVYAETLAKVGNVANSAALASLAEAAYHVKNQITVLYRSPGTGTVIAGWLKNAADVLLRDPQTMRQLVDLARIGALRPRQDRGSKLNPLTWVSRAVEFSDRVGRLLLDDAYGKLAAKGLAKDTETNRRNFINRFGQYNKRGQHRLVALARDLQIGPFATAGTNFYMQRFKSLLASPGVESSGPWAAARLRANVLMRYALAVLLAYLINELRKKRTGIGTGVPVGSVRLDNDEKGHGRYVDLLDLLTGLRGGARQAGVGAYLKEKEQGGTKSQAIDAGAREAIKAPLRPFEGPIVRFGSILATGKDPEGYQVAKKVGPDRSQFWENVKAAALHANPLVSNVTGGSDHLLGPFSAKTGPTADQSPAAVLAHRLAREQAGEHEMTEAERQAYQDRKAAEQKMRKGGPDAAREAVKEGMTAQQAQSLLRKSKLTDLQETVLPLTIGNAMKVWDAADEKERDELRGLVAAKVWRSRNTPPAVKRDYVEKLRARNTAPAQAG